jgi:hypothetical protein
MRSSTVTALTGACVLFSVFALALAGPITAAQASSAPGTAAKGEPAKTTATAGAAATPSTAAATSTSTGPVSDLRAALTEPVYERIARPVEAKLAEARMAVELIRLENEKPADKRNQDTIISLKEREAGFYTAAALAAREGVAQVTPPDLKAAIVAEFEKPNKQKAVEILGELAAISANQKDFRRASALYRRILAIDPENESAKRALKLVSDEALKSPAALPPPMPSGSGQVGK